MIVKGLDYFFRVFIDKSSGRSMLRITRLNGQEKSVRGILSFYSQEYA